MGGNSLVWQSNSLRGVHRRFESFAVHMKTSKDWILLGAGIAIVILLRIVCVQYEAKAELTSNVSAMADTLETTRNVLGEQVGEIESLKSSSKSAFLALRSRDADVIRLQKLVDGHKGRLEAAVISSSVTNMAGSGDIDSTGLTQWNTKFETGRIWRSGDKFNWDIKVRNEISLTIGKGRWNPFKRQPLKIQITQHNKNTSTTVLRSVTFKQGQSRIGLSGYGGYGLTFGWDGRIYHGFQAGIGVSWRIFP